MRASSSAAMRTKMSSPRKGSGAAAEAIPLWRSEPCGAANRHARCLHSHISRPPPGMPPPGMPPPGAPPAGIRRQERCVGDGSRPHRHPAAGACRPCASMKAQLTLPPAVLQLASVQTRSSRCAPDCTCHHKHHSTAPPRVCAHKPRSRSPSTNLRRCPPALGPHRRAAACLSRTRE